MVSLVENSFDAEIQVLSVPAWCQYVPAGVLSLACNGSDGQGCTCDRSCAEILANSWMWNPQCCGCSGEKATKTDPDMVKNSNSSKNHTNDQVLNPVALAVPAWCEYVPASEKSVACRGSSASGCTCGNSCAQVPGNTWQWNPECCGCGRGAGAKAAADMASLVEDSSDATVQALSVPAWCQYVPAGEQSLACRGSDGQGCTCDGSCAEIPANSWMWNPHCCGCSGVQWTKSD